MKCLKIKGPVRVHGEITVNGNKNAALPMIAAVMLTDEPVVLHNVPDILDVQNMLKIAGEIGAEYTFQDNNLRIHTPKIINSALSRKACSALRASFLYAGPLAVRCGKSTIYPPGGDVIGHRRLDTHFYGLQKLGIALNCTPDFYEFGCKNRPVASDIFLDEASVTATEHIMITAVLAKGQTIIRNAASEPHVTQLGELLNAMGAKISGLETNQLTIDGVEKLHGTEFTVGGDHITAASYLALAAATGGEIVIHGEIKPHDYWMIRRVFERFGVNFTVTPGSIRMNAEGKFKVRTDFGNAIPTISDGPWPQFPSDMMSCIVSLATQVDGTVLFFEKMFESRLYFVDKLISMGANAVVCDPHRVVISGPTSLHGIEMTSPDIRAGMAMIIAACCAKGTSLIRNADMVCRGYGNLIEKLRQLGVSVEEEEI